MARHPFPLVDVLIGVPNVNKRSGVPALLTHGTVIELFSDLACTVPLDAMALDAVTPITSVTVDGVTIPGFLGPNSEVVFAVYGRVQGTAGNGFPLYRSDAFGGSSGTDAEIVRDTIAAAMVAGTGIVITPNDAGDTITIGLSATPLTAEDVRDTIGAAIVAGTNMTSTVNDAGDTITLAAATDPEVVRDTMATALVAGANITITVDDAANTITITGAAGGSTDPEVVRDTVAAALVAGANMTITPDDAANTITLAATNTTDVELVRDTIGTALVAGAGMVVTVNDAGDTITLAVTGRLLTKGNGTIDLTAPLTDSVATWRIVDDLSSTASWIDRMVFRYSRPSGGASGWNTDHPTSWFNEYGELRVSPGRENTIPFRAFAADTPSAWLTRDKTVPIMEIVSDRTDRVQKWAVLPTGEIVALNVKRRVETVPTGTTGFATAIDGTLWVEYTP